MYDEYYDEKIYNVQNSFYEKIKKFKEPKKVFEKVKKIKENNFTSLYDELIIIIRLFQILGHFSISRDCSGRLNSKAYSPLAIHCMLIFIATSFLAYLTIYDNIYILRNISLRFDEKILHFAIISFMMIHFVPVIFFFERKKIAKYFENWDLFQAEFEKITQKPLQIKAKRKQKILLIYIILLFTTFLFFLNKTVETRFVQLGLKKSSQYSLISCYAYYGFSLHFCTFFWYFTTNALCQASTSLLNYFKECRTNGQSPNGIHVIWLRLQDLCCELGEACSYTYLFFLLYMFVLGMLIGYSAMANFGTDGNPVTGYLRFGLFFIAFLSLSIVPGFAHNANKKVHDDILDFVVHWAMEDGNSVLARDLKWMAEGMVLKKPAISLAGYVVLNRSVNISMYAAMVTYFVVVLQFKTTNES